LLGLCFLYFFIYVLAKKGNTLQKKIVDTIKLTFHTTTIYHLSVVIYKKELSIAASSERNVETN
jgi:hypothetical protein